MKQLYNLIEKVFAEGEIRQDRTNVGTLSVFGGQLEFDLQKYFPLVSFKKTKWESAFVEMLWFIRGEPNIKYLHDHNVHIWDEWADKNGNLGPVYGVQWRRWPGELELVSESQAEAKGFEDFVGLHEHRSENGEQVRIYQKHVDQLRDLIKNIKASPTGRRHIVTAWNPGFIHKMGLPPCHRDFQCYVSNDGHLDLMMSIRSWDLGLGGPFNIAQYALLTHLIARATNLKPRRLLINYGDAHVYLNHVDKLKAHMELHKPVGTVSTWKRGESMLGISGQHRSIDKNETRLIINTDNIDIDGYKLEDFQIEGYKSGPFLSLPIAV